MVNGYEPTQNLRSKTKVEEHANFQGTLAEMGIGFRWLFNQAEGGSSDCLVPVAIYPDPTRLNGYLVMTEVMNADGTPTSKIND
jgi:glutamine synthetase